MTVKPLNICCDDKLFNMHMTLQFQLTTQKLTYFSSESQRLEQNA